MGRNNSGARQGNTIRIDSELFHIVKVLADVQGKTLYDYMNEGARLLIERDRHLMTNFKIDVRPPEKTPVRYKILPDLGKMLDDA
jgi:hypothetical protein